MGMSCILGSILSFGIIVHRVFPCSQLFFHFSVLPCMTVKEYSFSSGHSHQIWVDPAHFVPFSLKLMRAGRESHCCPLHDGRAGPNVFLKMCYLLIYEDSKKTQKIPKQNFLIYLLCEGSVFSINIRTFNVYCSKNPQNFYLITCYLNAPSYVFHTDNNILLSKISLVQLLQNASGRLPLIIVHLFSVNKTL